MKKHRGNTKSNGPTGSLHQPADMLCKCAQFALRFRMCLHLHRLVPGHIQNSVVRVRRAWGLKQVIFNEAGGASGAVWRKYFSATTLERD